MKKRYSNLLKYLLERAKTFVANLDENKGVSIDHMLYSLTEIAALKTEQGMELISKTVPNGSKNFLQLCKSETNKLKKLFLEQNHSAVALFTNMNDTIRFLPNKCLSDVPFFSIEEALVERMQAMGELSINALVVANYLDSVSSLFYKYATGDTETVMISLYEDKFDEKDVDYSAFNDDNLAEYDKQAYDVEFYAQIKTSIIPEDIAVDVLDETASAVDEETETDDNQKVEDNTDAQTDEDDNIFGEMVDKDEKVVKETADQKAETEVENKRKAIVSLVQKIQKIQYTLLDEIYGQDAAIQRFCEGYFQATVLPDNDTNRTKPKAIFLFAGPPGVGKTFLAERVGASLDMPFKVFDMSSFSDDDASVFDFSGMHKSYKSAREGAVTSFVDKNPKSIIVFDEVEKAHRNVLMLFLQILDAGRLRDVFMEKDVIFKDCIIIFTTNAGKQLYESTTSTQLSNIPRNTILDALSKDVNPITKAPYFPNALCSRLASNYVIMFNRLDAHNLEKIAYREMKKSADAFERDYCIKVNMDERLPQMLLFSEGVDNDARTISGQSGKFIKTEILEYLRHIENDDLVSTLLNMHEIRFTMEEPNNPEAEKLLAQKEMVYGIVFADSEIERICTKNTEAYSLLFTNEIEKVSDIIAKNDIAFVLIDITCNMTSYDVSCDNVEDICSDGIKLFHKLRECYEDMPVYILETYNLAIDKEDMLSFYRAGARGKVCFRESDNDNEFEKDLTVIARNTALQAQINSLASSRKVLKFGTAQYTSKQGDYGEIRLYDFTVKKTIMAEDKNYFLNDTDKFDSFDDIVGLYDAKKELKFLNDYILNSRSYMLKGSIPPQTILINGPSGTGKTQIVRALAKATNATFISTDAGKLVQPINKSIADSIKDLFAVATKYAPSVLFIDEIDIIAKDRRASGPNAEHALNAVLTELDNLVFNYKKPVFVIVATNYELSMSEYSGGKWLDEAFVRRFNRKITLELPNTAERKEYIEKLLQSKSDEFCISQEERDSIASRSVGMSLQELRQVFDLAIRVAVEEQKDFNDDLIEDCFETICFGKERTSPLSHLERTARHESGHALLAMKMGATPTYVTIVARANHAGYMMPAESENAHYDKTYFLSRIRVALAGRAAEMVYYGTENGIDAGASSDLRQATALAEGMLCRYGMSQTLGMAVVDLEHCSDAVAIKVNDEVNEILARELNVAIEIIKKEKHKVDALVTLLLEKNYVQSGEIQQVLKD